MVLKAAELRYPRLYHTYVPAEADEINEKNWRSHWVSKQQKNDILLFTESYCRPCSRLWIKEYGKEFLDGKEIVLGYSKLLIRKNVHMRNFIIFDNLIHHLKFLSMAIAHRPFMGIGRNMAYKKRAFFSRIKAFRRC